ncbi:MAG: hypothetical protein U0350_51090 [Caldilineaceae bacterium]
MQRQRNLWLIPQAIHSQGEQFLVQRVLSPAIVLFCTLFLFCALTSIIYASNPNQKTTTTGQILTIEIADVIGQIPPGEVITLTGRATLATSQWQTTTKTTSIDHVEVRVGQDRPITATLDGQGNWSVTVKSCTMPTRVEATAVAQDGTQVMADFELCGPLSGTAVPEPTPQARLDKFIFLPAILAK